MLAGLSIAIKAGTAVRELLVAAYFGTTDPLDAYLISYAVPYFLITLLGASLPQVFVPAYIHLQVQGDRRSAARLVGDLGLVTALILGLVSVALVAGAQLYVPLVAPGFPASKLELSERLSMVLAPTVFFGVLTSLAAAILNSHRRFLAPALSPLASTAIIVASLVAFGTQLGIFALAYGILIGTTVEAVLLIRFAWREAPPRFGRWLASGQLRDLSGPFGTTLIGALLMASTLLIDQVMSADLAPGSVAALNYANRLVAVPLGLIAAGLGTVVLPYFSTLVAGGRRDELRGTVQRYLGLIGVTTVPVAVVLGVLASPGTDLLLRRGAFTGADGITVAACLSALAPQIPFYTGVILLMRVALAMRLNRTIAVVSAINLVLDIALNAWLSSLMGVTGIALSTSVVYAASFLMLFAATRRALRTRPVSPI
jgi:putative peptidoglycan lipid II flippase